MGEVNVKVEANERGEVVVLTGKALDPKAPKVLNVGGTIGCPLAYILKRKKTINPESAVIQVNYQKRSIVFIQDQYNVETPIITGEIELDPDLVAWGINSKETRSSTDLALMVRSNRIMFESIQEANELVKVFQNFRAKVQNELVDQRDNKGNKKVTQEQVVLEMSIPEGFTLYTPVIKNGPKVKIEVEIVIHPDTLEIQLLSPTINETMKTQCGGMIDEQIQQIKEDQAEIPVLYL